MERGVGKRFVEEVVVNEVVKKDGLERGCGKRGRVFSRKGVTESGNIVPEGCVGGGELLGKGRVGEG